jgi:gpW
MANDPCNSVTPVPTLRPALSCAQMLGLRMQAYNELQFSGQNVIEVRFGDQTVKYTAGNVESLLADIKRLHASCPTPESAALLGLGDVGPINVRFGCAPCGCR